MNFFKILTHSILLFIISGCNGKENNDLMANPEKIKYSFDKFCMGADLSYVNQIEDMGGVYRDSGQVRDPFRIFSDHGANTVRVRLWHSPKWTREVYGSAGKQMYSDLKDAEKTIRRAKEKGMATNLDFHFSDTWADPGKQNPPDAWKNITSVSILKDSVYIYVKKTLEYLNSRGLMPEMVQIGNEINCGMMVTKPAGFPNLNVCDGKWAEQGEIINAGIKAVREVSLNSSVKTSIILHLADPKNLEWWFDGIISKGLVNDFDIVGVSYYHIWHTSVSFDNLPDLIRRLKAKWGKKIMVVETAYPWTTSNTDSYNNIFGSQPALSKFPYSAEGQYDFMVSLAKNLIDAGASGVMYWEPAWITSNMKDPWGTGSAWENNAFFDFGGNTLKAMDFMNYKYAF
jgi:arabinogalactan endo-1,4-beta-galactosidase